MSPAGAPKIDTPAVDPPGGGDKGGADGRGLDSAVATPKAGETGADRPADFA